MRHLLPETIDIFNKRFEKGFHDSLFMSIEYDFDAGNPPEYYAHRVSVKISVPDWREYPPLPKRIILLFEMEGVIEYLFLKKQENRMLVRVSEIDIIIDGEYILLDFLPYYDSHPLRGRPDIYKHYEKEESSSLFIVKGKVCYWSIQE